MQGRAQGFKFPQNGTLARPEAESSMAKAVKASKSTIRDGDSCVVTGGTHEGKSGTARDLKVSKTGHLTLTIVQRNGERFKTLARNVAKTAR